MSLFDWFRKQKQGAQESSMASNSENKIKKTTMQPIVQKQAIDFSVPVTSEEEKELVSVIASAIAVGDDPDSNIRVKSIMGIDTEKEIAAGIAAAIAAENYMDSNFILKSIERIN